MVLAVICVFAQRQVAPEVSMALRMLGSIFGEAAESKAWLTKRFGLGALLPNSDAFCRNANTFTDVQGEVTKAEAGTELMPTSGRLGAADVPP